MGQITVSRAILKTPIPGIDMMLVSIQQNHMSVHIIYYRVQQIHLHSPISEQPMSDDTKFPKEIKQHACGYYYQNGYSLLNKLLYY